MRKTILTLFTLSSIAFSGHAQLISSFNWDSNPLTQATFGPNNVPDDSEKLPVLAPLGASWRVPPAIVVDPPAV